MHVRGLGVMVMPLQVSYLCGESRYLTTVKRRVTFYVDRVPGQPLKGRGWIKISDIEIVKRLDISLTGEHINHRIYVRVSPEDAEYEALKSDDYFGQNKTRGFWVSSKNLDGSLMVAIDCNRGKAGGKKFTVVDSRETVRLIVQKTLTIEAVCAWVKTWASEGTFIITPGGKTISLNGDRLDTTEYVYFIHSEENNAVKIGRAKNVEKRLKSLQTAHPYQLKVIKTFSVKGGKAAKELEIDLHALFKHLQLSGEWFKAEQELLNFVMEKLE